MPTFTDEPGQGLYLDYHVQDGALTAFMLDGDDTVTALAEQGHSSNTNDVIDLGSGDDIASVGGGDDIVHCGDGDDTVDGDAYFVTNATDDSEGLGVGADKIFGEGGHDDLVGWGGNDTLDGGSDNDDLSGMSGADRLIGGAGIDDLDAGIDSDADYLDGGADDDSLDEIGVGDTALGGAGVDSFTVEIGGPGATAVIDGGSDDDVISIVYTSAMNVTFKLGANAFSGTGLTVSSVERLYSLDTGAGADKITMSAVIREDVDAGAGNDTIIGGDGAGDSRFDPDDIISSGAGDDLVRAGTGADWIINRGGHDFIDAGAGNDRVTCVSGNPFVTGASGNTDLGTGNDLFVGEASSPFSDLPTNYTVFGNAGNDIFLPKAKGTYIFVPGSGNDSIIATGTVEAFNFNVGFPDYGATEEGDDARKITVDYSAFKTAFTVNLLSNSATTSGKNDTFANDPNGLGSLVDDIVGGSAGDTLSGDNTKNHINGHAGDNRLSGNGGNDTLDGGGNKDWLNGGAGDDDLDGNPGNDTLVGGTGNDTLEGGRHGTEQRLPEFEVRGGDWVDYSNVKAGMAIDIAGGRTTGDGTDKLIGIEHVQGSVTEFNNINGNDAANILRGGNVSDVIQGGKGDDIIIGFDGKDVLRGGAGNDYIAKTSAVVHSGLLARPANNDTGDSQFFGGDGLDTIITGKGADRASGENGDDTIVASRGNDTYNGGKGTDDVDFTETKSGLTAGVTATIASDGPGANTGTSGSGLNTVKFTFIGIENMIGTKFADEFIGNGLRNFLDGGAGDDTLEGGGGADLLLGGKGDDTYVIKSSSTDIREDLAGGHDVIKSTVSWNLDLTRFVEDLVLEGNARTGTGNDLDNTIAGNVKSNSLFAGRGKDILHGHGGDDVLQGDLDRDELHGELGADRFDFNAVAESRVGKIHDVIKDFSHAQGDTIDLSDIDANTHASGNQTFKFIGADAFRGDEGDLRYANRLLQGDVNGDGKADFEIAINAARLLSADLVL
ncbi:hypothetical protein BH10PSE7_BH10PSE7_04800 [soil metagenome]